MFEYKDVHKCTSDSLVCKLINYFVLVSSDLWLYIMDTQVKRGPELSNDHSELDQMAWEDAGQAWHNQAYIASALGLHGRGPCLGDFPGMLPIQRLQEGKVL